MATIDRGDSHFEDAGSWLAACHHMGVFLDWAARRDLADPRHQAQRQRLSEAPAAYVVEECDCKLLPDDFREKEETIRAIYRGYLRFYDELVNGELGSPYVVGLDDSLRASIDEFLDRRLQLDRDVGDFFS